MTDSWRIITPFFNPAQRDTWLRAWGLYGKPLPLWLVMQHDANRDGCGATKNRAMEQAIKDGVDIAIILDDDVLPGTGLNDPKTLEEVAAAHLLCLEPQEYPLLEILTDPPARGNPWFKRTVKLPVAASVGWWSGMPDRCAVRQLVDGVTAPMDFTKKVVYGRPSMICGMNVAYRLDFWPWCSLLPVSRMDDVFQSWLFCKEAARRHHCINFNGPTLSHSRQSHVFNSLIDEAKWLEFNDRIWSEIWLHPSTDYATLRALLPV